MILNLKTFNEFLKFKHSRLESFEDVLDLIREGCYFGSVYLKDAYYSIPVHENYRRHLTLFWKQEYYHYIVLANEFSPAVRVFTKVLSPLLKYLRSKGHLSVKYTDDSLLLGESIEICFKNTWATVALLRELGFTIQPERSVLVPTQQIIFLRLCNNSNRGKETVHSHALPEYPLVSHKNILSNDWATIREPAQTIGVIVSSFRAFLFGQTCYRELEKCTVPSLARSGGNLDKKAFI